MRRVLRRGLTAEASPCREDGPLPLWRLRGVGHTKRTAIRILHLERPEADHGATQSGGAARVLLDVDTPSLWPRDSEARNEQSPVDRRRANYCRFRILHRLRRRPRWTAVREAQPIHI